MQKKSCFSFHFRDEEFELVSLGSSKNFGEATYMQPVAEVTT